jgi:hypothetical protein
MSSPVPAPAPISRAPVAVEAAPRSSTSVSGLTEALSMLRLSGSAPADTSASMTSTDALRTLQ